MKDNKLWTLISENPGSILLLGACPALAAAADLKSGAAVGLLALVMLVAVTAIAQALKGLVGQGFRLPVFILLAAALCSAASMGLHALAPQVYKTMGIYTTLLAVGVAVFAAAQTEIEASAGAVLGSALKAGVIFLLAAVFTAAVCEFFGAGSIWGAKVEFMAAFKNSVLAQPAGKILIYGLAAALFIRLFSGKKEEA